MTINFTKAIELQTVRKLKSHSKVGYQDHPNGDKQCSGCSMYRPDIDPKSPCTHVMPPISPSGYCDDYQKIDLNEMLRTALGVEVVGGKVNVLKSKSFAQVLKDGPPDEARDEKGRWASGGTASSRDRSNVRGALRDAAWGPKVVAEAASRTQAFYENRMNTPKGYHWENGVLVEDKVVAKSFAEVLKDGPPDEARDDRGRWTTGGGSSGAAKPSSGADKPTLPRPKSSFGRNLSPYRQRAFAYTPGDELQQVRDQKQIAAAEQKVSDLTRQLSDHPQDKSEDLYWGVHRMLQQARDDLINLRTKLGKAYSPDEPRDAKGMWTTGGAAPAPDFIDGSEGEDLYSKLEDSHQRLSDHINDHVYEANQKLFDASSKHQDIAAEEDDVLEQHGPDSKQYAAWEARNNKGGQAVADAAMGYRQSLIDHANLTAKEIAKLDSDLSKHEADYGRRVGKVRKYGPSVSDVHPPTALGNDPGKWRPKWKDFLTAIGEIHGAKIVQIETDPAREAAMDGPPPAMDFGKALAKLKADALSEAADFVKRTVPVLFMRHGPTKFNNQTDMSKDRVRSWNNVPLTAEGIEDAQKAGEKLKDEGIGYIVSSDLGRAIQTSKIVGKAVGIKPIHDYGMRPWNLGKFTGMSTDEAHDGIMHYVENPEEVVPEGESFNTFTARACQCMLNHIKKAGGKKMLAVSHHRNERLFASMNPDGSVNAKKFMKTGEDPGDFTEMEFDTDELQNALKRAKEGQGEAEAKKVWDSNADIPDSVRGALPAEAQTVWRRVANDRIKAGQSEKSAIRQAWTAVKNGWRKEGDQWVRKFAGDSESLVIFTEQQIAKLKGDFPTTGPDVNAALHLNPLGANTARSPFPYNQYFFANLRNDQKERMLAALTDQDSLPVKVVRLSDLSAIQDRVDPDKVQSMLTDKPDKLPVVVRTGPGRMNIADGHHRLTAMLLSGVKTTPVKYIDISPVFDGVTSDGNPGSNREPVDKSLAMEIAFDVKKTVEDQQLVFGWASICSIGGEDVVDKQDDIIPEEELEKAAYDFALYCRQQGDMHERMGVGRLVESMMFTKQKQDAMGIDLGLVGWWVGFKVDDPGVWKRIKSGDLPEFSIGGKARREVVEA